MVYNEGHMFTDEDALANGYFSDQHLEFFSGQDNQDLSTIISDVETDLDPKFNLGWWCYIAIRNYPMFRFGRTLPKVDCEVEVTGHPTTSPSAIIFDMCKDCGLENQSVITVPQTTIEGYEYPNNGGTPRSIIEDVEQIGDFYSCERGNGLNFVPQSAPINTYYLNLDSDIAWEEGEQEKPFYSISRDYQTGIPTEIQLKYRNVNALEEVGLAEAKLRLKNWESKLVIESSATLSDGVAARVVNEALYRFWTQRKKIRSLVLSPAFSSLKPGEVISFFSNGLQEKFLVTRAAIGANLLVEVEGVYLNDGLVVPLQPHPDDGDYYPVVSIPFYDYPAQGVAVQVQGQVLVGFDVNRWQGGTVSFAPPSSTNFESGNQIDLTPFVGQLLSPLSAVAPQNTIIYSPVRMTVLRGKIESITTEQLVKYERVFLIDSEIIAIKTVTNESDTIIVASEIVRGLFNTDIASHSIGTKVWELKLGVSLPAYSSGATIDVSAVPTGKPATEAPVLDSVTVVDQVVAPTAAYLSRSGNDLSVKVISPLDEFVPWFVVKDQSYNFVLKIYNGASVVRTTNLSGGTILDYSYPAASQIADFGAVQTSSLKVGISKQSLASFVLSPEKVFTLPVASAS